MSIIKRGTQIIYVPSHADGDIEHPDCEPGFVTAVRGSAAFCRYWSKHNSGELRTKAGSELTPIDLLAFRDTVPKYRVDAVLKVYCPQREKFRRRGNPSVRINKKG